MSAVADTYAALCANGPELAALRTPVAHTREREQFGRPLSSFQVVQHTLASMAGEVE